MSRLASPPRYCPGVPELEPRALLLLPRPLEGFILEDQARDLLRADGVLAADPPRVRYGAVARLPAPLRATLAHKTARRLLKTIGGDLHAVAIFHPLQWPLRAGAARRVSGGRASGTGAGIATRWRTTPCPCNERAARAAARAGRASVAA